MTKSQITFEIIKTLGLLFEVHFQGPCKLGIAMEQFWNLDGYFQQVPTPEPSESSTGFLNMVYTGALKPEWLERVEGLME